MPKRKKTIHYVQLRTYRKWTNQSNYLSYLNVFHSKIKPITYQIDRIVNNKWIDIRRPQLIDQFDREFQQEIKKNFLHKVKKNTKIFSFERFCLDRFNRL